VDNVGMMHRISASLFLPRISNGRVIGKLTKAGRGVRRLAIMCVALFATSTLIMPRTPGRLGFDISCLGGGCVPTTSAISKHHGELYADRGEREPFHHNSSHSQDCEDQ
jgi:hypothetical protein